jgi:hypothetical protein
VGEVNMIMNIQIGFLFMSRYGDKKPAISG